MRGGVEWGKRWSGSNPRARVVPFAWLNEESRAFWSLGTTWRRFGKRSFCPSEVTPVFRPAAPGAAHGSSPKTELLPRKGRALELGLRASGKSSADWNAQGVFFCERKKLVEDW